MQGLINKINKSIIAPLPSTYSGPFRGLVKSMLRRSPEHRPSAAELLKHPHLQPYVLQVHLKTSPNRHSLPIQHPTSNHIKKIRFPDDEDDSVCKEKADKRLSFGNERIVKLNRPAADRDFINPTKGIKDYPEFQKQKIKDFSVGSNYTGESRRGKVSSDKPSLMKTPKYTPGKAFVTPRKQEPTKTIHSVSNHEMAYLRTPANRSGRASRRASLPLPSFETPVRRNTGILQRMESPEVSVNAPRIDRIAEFPLASSEDPLFSLCKIPSGQGSSSTPHYGDRSLTKDKCTVQIFRTEGDHGSDSSERNPAAVDASSRGSSESRQRRFDTSSFQQRAEALEGLLEFSAQLLQQERIEELGILLKPFGPGKASPRETAIWLTKSFKETAP